MSQGNRTELYRSYIEQWATSIELMRAGKLGTSAMRDGRLTDTTQETIATQLAYIAELKDVIALIERSHAQGS
jgi:hypothetical protein